jgi:8-oxo-dGTP pyrophosphatase MutT (NUDIX family)
MKHLIEKANTFTKAMEQSILSKKGPGYIFQDGDCIVGFVPESTVDALKESPFFQIQDRTISFISTNSTEKSQQMKELILQWTLEKRFDCLKSWKNEEYAVYHETGISFQFERAAAGLFGFMCYGTHLNGYVMDQGTLKMWVARRSAHKKTHPLMLDSLVGGGLPFSLSPKQNLIKEAYEEAGIPESTMQKAVPKGYISVFWSDQKQEWFPILDFVYDLELDPSFLPKAVDGEVGEFYLWDLPTVEQHLDEFTMDTGPVVLDFMVRHGYLTPEHSDYLEIVSGLRRPFVFPLRKH